MNLFNSILVGFKEIWAHKFRSLLTMLGIILGVSSLIGMSAITKGMENGMKESLMAMGGVDKAITEEQDVPAYQQDLADSAPGRTMRDVYALKNSASLLRLISPQMALLPAMASRADKRIRPSELVGVWPAALEMDLHVLEHGRFFTDLDEEYANPVCVIGTAIRDELFGDPDEIGTEIIPLGQTINLNGQAFRIIGMFQRYESDVDKKAREYARLHPAKEKTGPKRSKGWGSGRNWAFRRKNLTIYVPLNTMWIRFRSSGTGTNGIPNPKLSDIDIKVKDVENFPEALQQAKNVMMITHNGIEDFGFQTQQGSVENINAAIRNARMSGGIISAISLLVGGIGIMNIMLASITERIREIGIRKAIGASTLAIFLQILVESVVIALIGGVAGVATSFGLVKLLGQLSPTDNTPIVTVASMIFAFLCSAAIGLVAGIFPALKAAKLNPIQALRYE
ncbi:MAG: Macrolide export ATP-binding/permease protein MacB [Verrucomicrobiales bacterium]|nr:Macrolide export ATP-binding/permease protein MacB [Verrucomicrobiales bacterium]MDB6131046.1 Macrolide export ATP-binding/permease protein MacB [Verrucomicrobiales bacterium]